MHSRRPLFLAVITGAIVGAAAIHFLTGAPR